MSEAGEETDGKEKILTIGLPKSVDIEEGRKRRKTKDSEFSIKTTRPGEIRRHNISDEELEMLRQNSTDGMSEMFWGLLGGAIAATPSALEAIWSAYITKPPTPISLLHLIEIIFVIVGATGAVIVKLLSKGKSGRIEKLISDIRAREAK